MMKIVPLGAAAQLMEGAEGEGVARMHVDGLPNAKHEKNPEDQGVDAQADTCCAV
jgi:hypothetical protein